jgi:drug/metabolite transporter (DMT)-like permease
MGAIFWAFHVILIGILVQWGPVLRIAIGQYLVCGLLSLIVFFIHSEAGAWHGWIDAWWTVVYTGVLSIGIGYTLQLVGQRETPPSDAAIILSTEAVFAALFGWLLLDERLTGIQILGCVLMAAAMVLVQLPLQRVNGFQVRKLSGNSDRTTIK